MFLRKIVLDENAEKKDIRQKQESGETRSAGHIPKTFSKVKTIERIEIPDQMFRKALKVETLDPFREVAERLLQG